MKLTEILKEEGRQIWQRWQVAVGHALRLRLLVNQVEVDFLRENEWFEKRSGNRLLLPERAYLVSDIDGYCAKLEEAKREAGLMEGMEAGYCPALVAENAVLKIEFEIFKWEEKTIGVVGFAERVNMRFEERKKALRLFDNLFKNLKG